MSFFNTSNKEKAPWWLVIKKLAAPTLQWNWQDAASGVEGAKRVILGAIRNSRWLRFRFPNSLEDGEQGRYAIWIRKQLKRRLRHEDSALAAEHVTEAFRSLPHLNIIEHYLHDYRLRQKRPAALTTEGQGDFAKWLLRHGIAKYGWSEVDVVWLFQYMEEQPKRVLDIHQSIVPKLQSEANSAHCEKLNEGVNVFGHFTFCSGLQRSAVRSVAGLKQAGESVSLRNIPILQGKSEVLMGLDFLGKETYDVSLLHLTPDPYYAETYERAGLSRNEAVKRIGLYAWELPKPPNDSMPLDGLSEIWVYSQFVADALSAWHLPTYVIPPPLEAIEDWNDVQSRASRWRSVMELSSEVFIFLYAFDLSSTMERKNPEAVIEAYRRSTRKSDNTRLVLKVMRHDQHPIAFARLLEKAHGGDVIIITDVMDDLEMQGLLASCDCYVSLHRAEGFGFTMAESMQLAKTVIATNYSGNVDYMNKNNSLLVGWKFTEVPSGTLTYSSGEMWVDPDVADAAAKMREVLDNRENALQLGLQAQQDVREWFNIDRVASKMKGRLNEVRHGRRNNTSGKSPVYYDTKPKPALLDSAGQ